MAESEKQPVDTQARFRRRVLFVLFATALTIIGAVLALYAFDVFLLVFIAILIAVFLRGTGDQISSRTPIPPRVALVLVTVAVIVIGVLLVLFLGPSLANQMDQLIDQIPQSISDLESAVRQYEWGEQMLDSVELPDDFGNLLTLGNLNVLGRVTNLFTATAGVLTTIVLILFVGFYLAFEPSYYIQGFVALFPLEQRPRISEVLKAIGTALQLWLVARFLSMIVVAVLTLIGLLILNVPIALTLAIIAGVLSFVPNIGPLLAIIPATLVGLTQSPILAVSVIALYFGVQAVESYLITPYFERRTVHLPPALTMSTQVALGIVVGQLGLVLAAPLLVVAILVVKMLYVGDILHDPDVQVDASESGSAI